MKRLITLICLILSFCAFAAIPLQVVPLHKSPTPNAIQLKIVFPKDFEMERKKAIRSQLRLIGFPMGVQTRTQGLPPLRESPYGQNVRVVIDNRPYFTVNLDAEDSYDANLDVYRKALNFKLPFDLEEGEHVMRAYTVLSYGESIKKANNFDVTTFYVGEKKPFIKQDLEQPYLTYNEPQGVYRLKSPQDPVLLDFYISNCRMGRELYKVLVSVDGEEVGKLYQWSPYLIYGLKPGKHTVKIELLNPRDEKVDGAFSVTEREITVK